MSTNILAINFNHDGSAALLRDGALAGYVNTERFSRKKKHPGLRREDLEEVLAQAELGLGDLDHVYLCNLHNMDSPDIPNTHGSDLKETWFEFWINQTRNKVRIDDRILDCTINPDHHLLHGSLAYYSSPFDSAVIFVADPLRCAAYIGKNHRIYELHDLNVFFNAHVGYCYVAEAIFGSAIFGAGKVMGLAPYGKPSMPMETDYNQIRTMPELRLLAHRYPVYIQEGKERWDAALAYHMQRGLETQLTQMLGRLCQLAQREDVAPHLCLSGGTALNSVANQIAFAASPFKKLHLHPACGDDGTAIGAALWHWHHLLGNPKRVWTTRSLMYGCRDYEHLIDDVLLKYRDQLIVETGEDYREKAAELLARGRIVAWFQGASEIGPRALGHRSILADPRDPDMKANLNGKVKFREFFRPFAPSVLKEHALAWFGLEDSPFMLRVCTVLQGGVPAITHKDGTARIQTVAREDNPEYYDLIQAFYRRTRVPLLLNTSFNIKGEPIVETPEDALCCFLKTRIDHLVFRNRIVSKKATP